MKKTISKIIITSLLLLTACGKEKEPQVVTLTPATEQEQTAAQEDTPTAGDTPAGERKPAALELYGENRENADEGSAEEQESMTVDQLLEQSVSLRLINETGLDLDSVTVSFNSELYPGRELLTEGKLKDGGVLSCTDEGLKLISNAPGLKLSVVTGVKDEKQEFPAIDISDLTDAKVVLTKDSEGWHMYSR
ncbi:MAG: hypothetical protein IKI75_02855 [Lachnospiraceae bacterium]|nr:hypothetical protein [Lachnospiraceae bacterium]